MSKLDLEAESKNPHARFTLREAARILGVSLPGGPTPPPIECHANWDSVAMREVHLAGWKTYPSQGKAKCSIVRYRQQGYSQDQRGEGAAVKQVS